MEALLERLKEMAIEQGKRLVANPRVLRVVADPRLMKLVMHAMQVPHYVREGGARVAHVLGFATRTDLDAVRQNIESLEQAVTDLGQKVGPKSAD